MTTMVGEAQVGPMLRSWRERRRFSQQELSNRSTVSTRHLSRVETGRAHPTPDMILHLAENLEVPLRERNRLLLAAGYAPRYSERSLDDGSLSVVMDGLRSLLDAHLPYPALLLDDYWDVVDTNAAISVLLAGCSPALLEPPVNVIRLCLHEDGLARQIDNLDQWAGHLHHQAVSRAERTHDPRHHALVAEIVGLYGGTPRLDPTTGPVLTLRLRTAGGVLRMFSTSAQLTTATDAALEGLRLETFLPADEATRGLFSVDPA
ncbi:helix-turn-helix transcriptional regulator [Nocardioides albidus]|uniref:Helix-turn-helix transcriptional regulator n=1 Tax=Nocardioides albidus TaxID=1517589 RepID=A0A5C4WTC1_9ACTN|nr:helix-turn-helix transcriptional regulator [Nocardioides albidus]TNM50835.1 helix-turn-helix transcriptional regulator [Nocardioides albidus]